MSEQSIVNVRASVMVYDDSSKKWIPSGSSGTQGVSKVQIFQHFTTNAFRVVGRKVESHEVVINCAINRGLKYNQTTATFHQWRDQRQVYGLNFVSAEDATMFAGQMLRAIETVSASGAGSAAVVPATPNTPNTPRDSYQNGMPNNQTVAQQGGRPLFQQQQSSNAYQNSETMNHHALHDDVVEVCYSVSSVTSVAPPAHQQHARRSSQGSNSTSSSGALSQNSQSNIIYSSVTPNTSSPSRPAPLAPPPPPAPSGGKPQAGKGPPPAPALPANFNASSRQPAEKPANLAQDLLTGAAKLKKTAPRAEEAKETRSASVGSVDTNGARLVPATNAGSTNLMSEMAATLARRRLMCQEGGETPSGSQQPSNGAPIGSGGIGGGDTDSVTKISEKDSKRPWETKNGGRFDDKPVNDSPKTHRKVPSGSSLSSQEDGLSTVPANYQNNNGSNHVTTTATPGGAQQQRALSNGPANGSCATTISQEMLELWKREILNEVKAEIAKAKVDIIEALKMELNRR